VKLATYFTFALLALTGIVLQAGFKFDHAADPPYPSLTFQTELMTPQTDVTRLLGQEDTSPDRREIGSLQFVDFILISLYTSTFILLALRAGTRAKPLVILACVSIVITGILDVLEDRAILLAIGWWSAAQPQNVALFGFPKWAMFYVSTLLLGVVLVINQRPGSRLRAVPGLSLCFVAVLGIGALALAQYATVARLLGLWGIALLGAVIVV
jgi:hypothetical protein